MEQKNPLKIPKILWFQLFLLALGYAFYSANLYPSALASRQLLPRCH